LLTLLLSSAYCQVTETNNGYLITRNFAEFIAARFDSLEAYKKYQSAFDSCRTALELSTEIIKKQDNEKQIFIKQLSLQQQQIDSYQRQERVCIDLQRETRKKKAWKYVAIAGFCTTFITTTILILR